MSEQMEDAVGSLAGLSYNSLMGWGQVSFNFYFWIVQHESDFF